MRINLIATNQLEKSSWTQGTTTQYFIYPHYADYNNKDFLFRISSASIDSSPAIFTNFNGYTRYLAMLDNTLNISINGTSSTINPLEIICFNSEDSTTSFSLGNDFNLMVKSNIPSTLTYSNTLSSNATFIIIFTPKKTQLKINNISYQLSTNDCIIIENKFNNLASIQTNKNCLLGEIKLHKDEYQK